MAEEGKAPPSPAAADAHLFGLLSNLLQQVESLTNQEEVELRAKIETLGLEVRKLPSKSAQHLNEMEIANELDKLSTKLDHVDELISSTMAEDPQVRALLSTTADIWLPVITATSDERRAFTSVVAGEDGLEEKGKSSEKL
ncbi:ecotropic viral integration site protein [Perilla frutescens var. hirtella]|uniref:Ecotropic viral integration site protein n=1 Tax=Perilla frutescens var. hirtella TaxID=608512 RepID=A0AAD4IMN0_PERFH|nr:ecotropic viral integration site protein [Perilla frutescens var. hirtella]